MRLRHYVLSGLVVAAAGAEVHAHHSYAEYDDTRMEEIEGTLVRAAMQNPHVRFSVQGVDKDGRPITWDVEITSLNWLQRLEVPFELFRIGSRVKFAGWPSKRSPVRMYGLNMLAAERPRGPAVSLGRTALEQHHDQFRR